MLEQKEFTDENGTVWLNRPGPQKGAPMGWLLLMVASPLLIMLWGTRDAYILGGLSVVFLAITMMGALVQGAYKQTLIQTCPKCHRSRQKGYLRCLCGYPER
jgi:hypothetical protein